MSPSNDQAVHKTLFVFDIETIPDTDAVENLTGYQSDDVEALRAELERYHLEITDGRNPFARQPFHKIIAISFLRAEISAAGGHESYRLQELRPGGREDAGEADLINGFFQYFERLKPRLVSFNGRGFDLPVLKYRAMKHGISAGYLYQAGDRWSGYTHRYSTDWHCDLLDLLSDHGASARVKLNEVCSILGIPGKLDVEGAQVTERYDAGELGIIRDYCDTDVLNTYLLYLRTMLHMGRMDSAGYDQAVNDVVAYIEREADDRPHLGRYLEAWRQASGGRITLGSPS